MDRVQAAALRDLLAATGTQGDWVEASDEFGEALLVVAQHDPSDLLLERIGDARRRGARILTLDENAAQLRGLAHDTLTVPSAPSVASVPSVVNVTSVASGPGPLSFDSAQHLVSLAAATPYAGPTGLRARLGRWIEAVSGPRVERW